jgi:hypothetical protein
VIGKGPVQVRGKCRGAGVRERNGKFCKKPQSDKQLTVLRPDRGGGKWFRASL